MTQPSPSPPTTSSMLREACADLLRRLRHGETARAELYFETSPALAAEAETAVELIYTEFAAREEAGGRPEPEEYLARFPQWSEALRRQFDIHKLLNGDGPPAAPAGRIAGSIASATAQRAAAGDLPECLGAYKIIRKLGRGGMGTVYLASHGELGRLAAVKLLHGTANRSLAERFRTEVRSAAALGHPQIVQLYELGEAPDGRLFAAFEFVEGGSLRQALAGRPRSAREAAELVRRLAEALDCAHRAGIVHCDLTPANVLLARDGSPKIADFGLARLPRSADDDAEPDDGSPSDASGDAGDREHLSSAALAGTPGYLAPERIENPGEAAPAADIYGLGAIFYELLTGRPPHMGATPLETLRQARDYDPPAPRTLVPNIPRDAATICMKCLERDPARRYSSAALLAKDLQSFLAGEPIAARPVGAFERAWKWARRRPGLAAALATTTVALVVLAVGGTWYSVRLREALDRTSAQEQRIRGQALDLSDRNKRLDRSLYTMQLNQAEALVDRAPHQSLALLRDETRCPPERRDFAWGLLVRRASQDRRTFLGHQGPVGAVVVNGEQLITAGLDDTVRRWNLTQGTLESTTPVTTADAVLVVLSPDGSRLAAAYADHTARLWNLATGSPPSELVGHGEAIVAMTFFNGGRWLATAAADGHIRIWDPGGGPITDWPVAEAGEILTLAATADDQTLAIGLTGGGVHFLNSIEGSTVAARIGRGGGPAVLNFTADGKRMLSVDAAAGRLELWELGEPPTSRLLELPAGFARTSAVSPDGRYLAYATAEQLIRIVRIADSEVTAEYRGHTSRIAALAFTPDSLGVVSASDDRTVKLWDVPGRRTPQLFPGDDFKTWAVAFSHDGRRLATAGADGAIRVDDVSHAPGDAKTLRLAGHAAAVRALRFLPGDKQLLSGGEDNTVRLWDLASAKQLRSWEHSAWVLDLVVEADGKRFFTADAEGRVRRYALDDSGTKPQLEFRAHDASIQALALSSERTPSGPPQAALLATASRSGALKLWNAETGADVGTLVGHEQNVLTLDFSPDQQTLAAGDDAGCVILWDIRERTLRHKLRGHSRGVYSVAFSPDGRVVASASGGRWVQTTGEVKLWDAAGGQVHATLDGFTAPLSFRPDGLALAAALDTERKIAVWTAAPYQKP